LNHARQTTETALLVVHEPHLYPETVTELRAALASYDGHTPVRFKVNHLLDVIAAHKKAKRTGMVTVAPLF
jgi:hypothetical protein